MRLTFRTKLMTIVGTAAVSFIILIVAQTVLVRGMELQLAQIQGRFIPVIEMGPRLTADFEHLRRSFQDSVSAQDKESLERTRQFRDELLDDVSKAAVVVEPSQISNLKSAVNEYYDSAYGISRRLMAGETGVTLVGAMTFMQAKQNSVEQLLRENLTLDRGKLMDAFSSIERSQKASGRMLLLISVACLLIVLLLSGVISQSVLRSLSALSEGLKQFGQGNFTEPVIVKSHDELADLANEANQMAVRTQALMKELESFSYSVAHDLRAPLRSMLGFSKIILEDHGSGLPADAKEALERVMASAKRMGQLIDSLLSLSRLARAEIKKESVNLSVVASDVLSELQNSQPDRKIRIDLQPGVVVKADPSLMRVVLTNLLSNAWKFTSKTPEARIQFGTEVRTDGRVFFVRDNGAGFDMQYVGKLFGTFQRLHSNEDFEGTGIGLATVQTIIRRHGGEIWAEGKLNEGATLFFRLGKRTSLSVTQGRGTKPPLSANRENSDRRNDVESDHFASRG